MSFPFKPKVKPLYFLSELSAKGLGNIVEIGSLVLLKNGATIVLQYELAFGPSTGKAVTMLKWNLVLDPYRVKKPFPVHFA